MWHWQDSCLHHDDEMVLGGMAKNQLSTPLLKLNFRFYFPWIDTHFFDGLFKENNFGQLGPSSVPKPN